MFLDAPTPSDRCIYAGHLETSIKPLTQRTQSPRLTDHAPNSVIVCMHGYWPLAPGYLPAYQAAAGSSTVHYCTPALLKPWWWPACGHGSRLKAQGSRLKAQVVDAPSHLPSLHSMSRLHPDRHKPKVGWLLTSVHVLRTPYSTLLCLQPNEQN
ncbi:uncharacterized protein UV8b_06292 [Ustilaginoidea virens]|uniref:Uncharacterized protein n=1 Tax=Ustilaginoidea virens TaxID=1159556 RepID=A0A8E5MJH2_USTVR|nr:uncharacterized protein UV8b_06292 [Ustilaginoidea virens]QUC22051.1 hypothetical protein UV8b_06292 [Ustilaginoidea virens]